MDANDWNERYAATDLIWSAEPNQFVAELVPQLNPGHAIDIAAGEGRNAIWLVQQGWTVTATDYSSVAVERIRARAAELLGAEAARLTPLVHDATVVAPASPAAYDLALFCYLQLPPDEWRQALRHGVEAVRPGGHVLVIGHSARNLSGGWGGPPAPEVLYDPDEVVDAVDTLPVRVTKAEIRVRTVETEDGPRDALDTVVLLERL